MFKWTLQMQIDNGQLDEDHRKLISIANRVLELNRPNRDVEEIKLVIRELYDYVKYHFSREENLMRELNYPEIADHHKKHQAIVADMNHYLTSSHHMNDILSNFRGLVDKWVINHIMEEDEKIRRFMESKPSASK